MAKKKPKIPYRIVLPSGESYRLVVLLVHTKHPDGTPALCKTICEQDKVELAGGEEFMTAYFPSSMIGNGGGG